MREIRLSGSEGGGFELNRFSLPLLVSRPFGAGRSAGRVGARREAPRNFRAYMQFSAYMCQNATVGRRFFTM